LKTELELVHSEKSKLRTLVDQKSTQVSKLTEEMQSMRAQLNLYRDGMQPWLLFLEFHQRMLIMISRLLE
jgi:hypothetical protein